MKKLGLLLLITLLTSCAPAATTTLTIAPTQAIMSLPTATQTPSPMPTIIPTPTQIGGGSGRLIVELNRKEFVKFFPGLRGKVNIFLADVDGTNLIPITNGLKDYNYVESVSQDGTKVLVDSSSKEFFEDDRNTALYLIDLTHPELQPVKLGGGFLHDYHYDVQGKIAKFLSETQVVYIGQGTKGYGIYTVNIDGTNQKSILSNALGVTPVEILFANNDRIYWASATKDFVNNTAIAIWQSNIDGSGDSKLISNGSQIKAYNAAFSPDGKKIAWVEEFTRENYNYHLNVASISEIDNPKQLTPNSPFLEIYWFPDSSRILIFDDGSIMFQNQTYLDPSSKVSEFYEVSLSTTLQVTNLNFSDTLIKTDESGSTYWAKFFDFSPDGQHILVALPPTSDGNINSLDFVTLEFKKVLSGIHPIGAYWLP